MRRGLCQARDDYIAVNGSEGEVININGIDDYTISTIESSDDDDDINIGPCEESNAEGSAVVSSTEYTSSDAEVESSLQVHSA